MQNNEWPDIIGAPDEPLRDETHRRISITINAPAWLIEALETDAKNMLRTRSQQIDATLTAIYGTQAERDHFLRDREMRERCMES